jgi:hypothetical protein
VTDKICYSPGSEVQSTRTNSNVIYRTMDGGVHWTPSARVPVPAPLGGSIHGLHCTNAVTCYLLGPSKIVLTEDGGASWISVATPVPVSGDAGVWCANAQRCVVVEGKGGTVSAFATTTDGGIHWTTQPAPAVAGEPWEFTCDESGSCLEALLGPGTLETLTSTTWGGAWTADPSVSITRAAIVYSACPDATHCMFVSLGTSFQIITTTNAGLSWAVSGPPAGWLNTPTAVACANSDQCWIAMSLYDQSNPQGDGAYSHPLIESTDNFGRSWQPLRLPTTTPPIADVLTLSCPPSGAGCLAIGNGRDHFVRPEGPLQRLSGPILLSSLP